MAHEVKKLPVIRTRGSAPRRYLFFDRPPALWVADRKEEDHADILKASRRNTPSLAGWFIATLDELKVDALGSLNLKIPTQRPDRVCDHISGLPGKSRQSVKKILD